MWEYCSSDGSIHNLGPESGRGNWWPWGTLESIYVKNKKDLYADGLNEAGPSHWKPLFWVLHA